MIVGTPAQRPMIFALPLFNCKVVDARVARRHQTFRIEFPIFIAVRAEPVAFRIMKFIGEAHGNAVPVKGPKLLDEAIVELYAPLAREESYDLLPSDQEFRA